MTDKPVSDDVEAMEDRWLAISAFMWLDADDQDDFQRALEKLYDKARKAGHASRDAEVSLLKEKLLLQDRLFERSVIVSVQDYTAERDKLTQAEAKLGKAELLADMDAAIINGMRAVLAVARMVNNINPDIRMTHALANYDRCKLAELDSADGAGE